MWVTPNIHEDPKDLWILEPRRPTTLSPSVTNQTLKCLGMTLPPSMASMADTDTIYGVKPKGKGKASFLWIPIQQRSTMSQLEQ